jgi:hypothetical protein
MSLRTGSSRSLVVAAEERASSVAAGDEGHDPFVPARDCAFVVVSCDAYRDLWDPFFGCMTRYWPDCPLPLYLVTNEADYQRPGVTVIRVGPDRDYSSNLAAAVAAVPTPWLIAWIEDLMFTSPVDTERVLSLLSEAVARRAGYLKLSTDAPLSYDDGEGERIGEIPRGVRYRSAIGTAFYRRETLQALLVPGWSAWELDRSTLSDRFAEPFMALTVRESRRPPLPVINTVIKGRWHRPAVSFFRREGFGSILPGRQVQTWKDYLYIRVYLMRVAAYRIVRRHWWE